MWRAYELNDDLADGVLANAPESWDGDEAIEHIALSYVATLEARLRERAEYHDRGFGPRQGRSDDDQNGRAEQEPALESGAPRRHLDIHRTDCASRRLNPAAANRRTD